MNKDEENKLHKSHNSPIQEIKEIIVESVKDKSKEIKREVKHKADDMQDAVHKYVKEHPWKTIGFSALAGMIIAKLFRKKL
jgi:ElaB/YqjD/DUF883 family membrane-anchored ribosome-binding protein